MAQWQDEVVEAISGGAVADPYVTREGGVAAICHCGYRGSTAVIRGGSDSVNVAACASDSPDTLTADGTRIHSFRSGGAEKAYIDKDGELHHGATWDDIQGPALEAGGNATLTQEQFGDVTGTQLLFMRHDQDDTLTFAMQMSHRWIPNTEVRFHAHIVPMAAPASAQVIRMTGKFAWMKYGAAVPANAAWTAFEASHTVDPGDLLKPTIIPLFATTPTGSKESDFLVAVVTRPGQSDSADTYTTSKAGAGTAAANVCLLNCDAHFQVSKAGTHTEIPT
jgi:hypothetical protein